MKNGKYAILLLVFGLYAGEAADKTRSADGANRPNILFCIADDWGWPHAGAYGDPVVKTPAFDRLAREGILFDYAYVSSPSCTPCRNALFTGQHFYRLEEGANLWSTLDVDIPVYPPLLEKAGYHVGFWRKSWGPGNLKPGGYTQKHPAGKSYNKGFKQFLDARPAGKPFCFWLGASDPHRPYKPGSGRQAGMDLSKVPVPPFWPDAREVRSDIADYYFEVQRFNNDVMNAIRLLEETGELDRTLIVMTGDHGMPFPRCKGNLYDMGARVPLAMRWGDRIEPGRRSTDFVSFVDLAPTFLAAAGVDIPDSMTGKSLLAVLGAKGSGRADAARDFVITGRERHTPAQTAPSMDGYPSRAIRTDRWLYIRNLKPDRWPAGVPENSTRGVEYADCDNGPTKTYILQHRDSPDARRSYQWCFARRPAEELYDCRKDPFQITNLADQAGMGTVKKELRNRLDAFLQRTGDPRITGKPVRFDEFPYYGRMNRGAGK